MPEFWIPGVLPLPCYEYRLDPSATSVNLGSQAHEPGRPALLPGLEFFVSPSERRQLERFRIRVPLRFRPLGLASGTAEHFAETANISRGGFFFVTSAPLQVGMPIEATLNMPAEVTGGKSDETHCRARLVHAKPDAYSDGRMGFGAEIEMYIEPKKSPEPAPAQPPKLPADPTKPHP